MHLGVPLSTVRVLVPILECPLLSFRFKFTFGAVCLLGSPVLGFLCLWTTVASTFVFVVNLCLPILSAASSWLRLLSFLSEAVEDRAFFSFVSGQGRHRWATNDRQLETGSDAALQGK